MDYSKGGRGKKAPYKSAVCRVPSPLKGIVDALTERFKELIATGEEENLEDTQELWERLIREELVTSKQEGLSKEEAIEYAEKLLRAKTSKKETVTKLLQVIYGGDIDLNI